MSSEALLTPLRFEPIYQYRLWGGRKLQALSSEPLPGEGPIGEAWILSDRDDFASVVAEGPFQGKTMKDLFVNHAAEMLGSRAGAMERYPLLLKFLDAREMLSVQVHPSDQNKELLPPGERGKTEAWVVLDSEPTSHIYAGLAPGTTAETMRHDLANGTVEKDLASFTPKVGDGLFIEAGTVHALGGGVVVFEVQQNSDVTFRLYDWNRVDAKTGQARELHIDQALQCTNYAAVAVGPTTPVVEAETPARRERLFDCEFFTLWRHSGAAAHSVGAADALRVIVCVEGGGSLHSTNGEFVVRKGETWLLPASVGEATFTPNGDSVVLEVGIPA